MGKSSKNSDSKNREWSLNAHHPLPCDEFSTELNVGAAAAPAKKKVEPMTPSTPQVLNTRALRTVCVSNLSRSVTKSDLIDFFKAVGEVVDVRLAIHPYVEALVEFATEEAAVKGITFDFRMFLGRPVRVCLAPLTISVQGFDTSLSDKKIRKSLHKHFRTCGQIYWIFIVRDDLTGPPNGLAFLMFSYRQAFSKALAMNGIKLGDSPLIIEDTIPLAIGMKRKNIALPLKHQLGPYCGTLYQKIFFSERGYLGSGIGKSGSPYNFPPVKKIKFNDDDDDE